MPTRFYLFPRPDKYGDCPIRVSISIRGTRLISTAGYNIPPEKWNSESQQVKKGHNNTRGVPYNVINARLKAIDSHFANYEIGLDHTPTKDELAEHLAFLKGAKRKRKQMSQESTSVLELFDKFVLEEGRINQWTEGTVQCWMAFRKHLSAQNYKCISDIDESSIAKFVDYLRLRQRMSEKTTEKHYRNLMWFLGWCSRNGYYKSDSFRKYKPKFKVIAPPVIFLTKEELLQLYHYEIPQNGTTVILKDLSGNEYKKTISDASALEKTRDLFCFCAFTSLRYSDMANLRRSDIIGDCIQVVTRKTNDSLIINLNDYSRAILDKYKDRDNSGGLALPVISNQRMNDYIKVLGELCGFNTPISKSAYVGGQRTEVIRPKWEMLGTHAGRRTFICFALSQGIPPQVVMKWTGHSDYKAMKPYIDVAESTKADAMKNLINTLKR